MKRVGGFLLLETLIATALLALLAVGLLRLQTDSVRQLRRAEMRRELATVAEELIWHWHENGVDVTQPDQGQAATRGAWRREARTMPIANGVNVREVTLTVTDVRSAADYRVSWWVPVPRERQR